MGRSGKNTWKEISLETQPLRFLSVVICSPLLSVICLLLLLLIYYCIFTYLADPYGVKIVQFFAIYLCKCHHQYHLRLYLMGYRLKMHRKRLIMTYYQVLSSKISYQLHVLVTSFFFFFISFESTLNSYPLFKKCVYLHIYTYMYEDSIYIDSYITVDTNTCTYKYSYIHP